MRVYHMVIEENNPADFNNPRQKEYLDTKQGAAPAGWHCVGVCGFHDQKKEPTDPMTEAVKRYRRHKLNIK